jgi:hypothetical protein
MHFVKTGGYAATGTYKMYMIVVVMPFFAVILA